MTRADDILVKALEAWITYNDAEDYSGVEMLINYDNALTLTRQALADHASRQQAGTVGEEAVQAIKARLDEMVAAMKAVVDAVPDDFLETNADKFERLIEAFEACSDENLAALTPPEPSSEVPSEERRERIARIIDPEAWSISPRTSRLYGFDERRREGALAKADTILKGEM